MLNAEHLCRVISPELKMLRHSAVPVLLWILAVQGCSFHSTDIMEVSGTIEATTIGVGSRVGGRIADVLVDEGDVVKANDVLIRLECGEQEAAVAAAKAKLEQAEATLTRIETGARMEELAQAEAAAAAAESAYLMALNGARSEEIGTARAMERTAAAELEKARANFERVKKLFEGEAVSEQDYDQALRTWEAAQGQHTAAREQLDMLARGTRDEQIQIAKADRDRAVAAFDLLKNGARKEDVDFARAARDAADADLRRAETVLREMTVLAPRDSVVQSLDIYAGDIVQAGPVMNLVDPEDLELVLYVSALFLGRLRVGQEIEFTTDSHGDEIFNGKISFIASEGEFTPRNLQTQEERVQQMYGVKVSFDSYGGKLRAGMAATAHLDLAGEPAN